MTKTFRTAIIAFALFALNAIICFPLFRIEYLDDFQSNEGSWITFAAFLRQYWPHAGWFPWFDAGMPFENTYLPGISTLVAIASFVARCSPAHAFHFVAALAYALAPVSLFLFAFGVSGRLVASASAGLLWSLFSPSLIVPGYWHEMGTAWGIRRLRDIVYWGDTPHNVAICLLPISLLFTWRYLETPSVRRFALAALASAAVMLTNAFGIVVIFISSLLLLSARKHPAWKGLGAVCGIQFAAYLAVCRFLPPSLIRLLQHNSQFVAGDYRLTRRIVLLVACFVAMFIVLWAATRRVSSPILRFAILFSVCFGGIAFLGAAGINLLPQPVRYHLEFEPGICLLAAFLISKIPWRIALICAFPLLLWVAIADYRYASHLIHPADIAHSKAFREARWISTHLPGRRVLVATESEFLLNLFSGNPQMSAGHEPSSPNWIQKVAIYTIESGQNAGAQDGPVSILWLKAFGCGAIVVAGRYSADHYHAVAKPEKFDGLVPLLWRESGESIYEIPQRSSSLAHVIPRSAVVAKQPLNGLDIAEISRYVDALESPALPEASLEWDNPEHAKITAAVDPSQLLSIQINYDPGWEAFIAGRKAKISADKLGFILIDPECTNCSIDLRFTGGWERKITLGVSLIATMSLLVMFFWARRLVS